MQQATWLFFRKEADLKEEEREHLRLLKQASPKAEGAFQLVNKFLHMVRGRTGEQLDGWLKEVEATASSKLSSRFSLVCNEIKRPYLQD